MILLSTDKGIGINPFFPILIKDKKQNILVIDWNHYKRLLPLFVVINSSIALVLLYLGSNQNAEFFDTYYPDVCYAQLAYAFLRLKFGRRLITLNTKYGVSTSIAPSIVWLDYISVGAMFVITAKIGLARTESDFLRVLYFFLLLFFITYSLLPIANYYWYRTFGVRPRD